MTSENFFSGTATGGAPPSPSAPYRERSANPLNEILSRLTKVKKRSEGQNWDACCPAHEDKNPSLSVGLGDDGRVLLKCQKGCSTESVVGALGLTLADLFPAGGEGEKRLVAFYDYTDETGGLLFQTVRTDPKDFFQRRPKRKPARNDVADDWINNLAGVPRVLYRLPELLTSPKDAPVFVVEGEKDVDAVRKLGLVATCNPMGAGKTKWRREYNQALAGRKVYVIPDRDPAGKEHAENIVANVRGVAASVALLELPGKGKDAADWIRDGGTKDQLLELVAKVVSVSGPEEEPWPSPVPLNETPDVDPFPVDVLPPDVRQIVREVGEAMAVPPDFPAAACLVLAGGAIGNARHLSVTRTHPQTACLYLAIVSAPGTTKSAPLRLLRRPLDEEHRRRQQEWKSKLAAWEQSDRAETKPVLARCIVDDITTESLGLVLAENPRGVVMVRPELAALVTGLNQYKQGKGHDRQVYLKLWDGDTIIIDRKSDRSQGGAPLYVTDPFCPIIGTIQPDVVPGLRGDRATTNDGFIDRYLFCFPDPLPVQGETWREVSEKALAAWRAIIESLLKLEMARGDDGASRPFFVKLAISGRAAWEAFTREHAAEMNGERFPEHLRGPWSKLRAYCGRLALILHFLRVVGGEVDRNAEVDGESVSRAARLVAYFKSHARRAYSVMDADRRVFAAKKILAWLAREKCQEFKRWQAHKDLASESVFPAPDSLDEPLKLLEAHQWIRLKPADARQGPGRRAADTWLAHPCLGGRDNRVNRENEGAVSSGEQ